MMTKVHLDDFEKIQLILETPFSNMRDQVKFLQEYGWITRSPTRFQRTQAVQEKPSWAALVSKTWIWSSSKFYIVLFLSGQYFSFFEVNEVAWSDQMSGDDFAPGR